MALARRVDESLVDNATLKTRSNERRFRLTLSSKQMFELPPHNREQPDAVLLDDLRRISSRLGDVVLTRQTYRTNGGRFSPATIANRFGGWGKAILAAGLKPARQFDVSRDDALNDLRRVAELLDTKTLSRILYRQHGRFSDRPFNRHFGGWPAAVRAAGLNVSEHFFERVSDEELFENLEHVWQTLGRAPTTADMRPPISRLSAHVYTRRFGNWRKALESFVAAVGENGSSSSDPEPQAISFLPVNVQQVPRSSRTIGWRLRWLVMKRDRFTCRACGRSPATHAETVLHVDHVIPWSKGGETVESNLRTLCEQCNVGKGALLD